MLIDVVVVDEQRVNVPKADVEERRNFGARRRDINKRSMLLPIATSQRSRQVRFIPPFRS